MSVRTLLLLVVALVTAGMTAYFAKTWIAAERAALEVQPRPENDGPTVSATRVLVAAEDMSTGTFVRPERLKWMPWPEEALNEDYIIEGIGKEGDFEGAVVRSRLFEGEPITRSRVVHPGERGFLAAVLEPGRRAVAVPVDATTGIAGFVFPGDRVDVLLSIKTAVKDEESGDSNTRYFSQTLLTDIRVLAIDQVLENEDGSARVAKTATLEVSPKQAERIAIGLELGALSLSLRSLARERADDGGASGMNNGIERISLREDSENQRSYTRDIDTLFMFGDPLGLPLPGGAQREINVLHGKTVEKVPY